MPSSYIGQLVLAADEEEETPKSTEQGSGETLEQGPLRVDDQGKAMSASDKPKSSPASSSAGALTGVPTNSAGGDVESSGSTPAAQALWILWFLQLFGLRK